MRLAKTLTALNKKLTWAKDLLPWPLRRRVGSLYRRLTNSPNSKDVLMQEYLGAMQTRSLSEGTVMYESFGGKSMNCSPRAIFDALLENPDYSQLSHVWVLLDPKKAPEGLSRHARVRFIKPNSKEYARELATAEIIVNNSTLPTWYQRRDGQTYANTWHGVPLKRMFKHESPLQPTVHRNSQRNFLQASHILMPNDFSSEALLGAADVLEAVSHRIASIGAPRVDETLKADREAIRRELGVQPDQKLVFAAPTWRGFLGKTEKNAPMFDALLDQLSKLEAKEYVVFAQLHNFVGSNLEGIRGVPSGMSTNRFLAAVDVLITDYSSIMFDFLATGRQLVLYVYDRVQYEELRGLNCELEDLPAQICMRPKEVMDAVRQDCPSSGFPQFEAARERFFPLEDGNATERAIEAIFSPVSSEPCRSRPRILFFGGGWKNNGITSSMLNLLTHLGRLQVDVYVVTQGASLDKNKEYRENLARIDNRVRLIHRAGEMVLTKSERSSVEQFYSSNSFASSEHEKQIGELFERESKRVFGDMTFDLAVDFSGYARFWSQLIARTPANHHAIYQHNDMKSEALNRFNVLHGVFATYRQYDRIVSVSEETRKTNLGNLANYYRTSESSVTVRNMIVPEEIRGRALNSLPSGLELPEDRPVFSMVGRLSLEKAQGRAIRALGLLRQEAGGKPGVEAGLVIMGDGPIKEELEIEARNAGVDDLVMFAGYVANPFPVIAKSDCFLLSSDYEGQPMVLLEALTLGKPVIATDIPGARSVLGNDFGLLVEPSDHGVLKGMQSFISGEITRTDFEAEKYCETALEDFFSQLLDIPIPPARQ